MNQLTNEEYEQIIQELVGRVKDLVYSDLEKHVKQRLPKELLNDIINDLESEEPLNIQYNIAFLGNDIRQILARIRRKKDE